MSEPSESTAESKQPFQAEVRQLLDIVIHSLYTNKEIFVRELVSNATDALEKLSHVRLTEREIFDDRLDLEINITTDETARTITIQDYGVGMTREELAKNLGTLAHSGTQAFAEALKESDETRSKVIGQFGVGFYSAFMVADKVEVYTHSWKPDAEHLVWTSDGETGYVIEQAPGQRRGARIVVHLNEDQAEFAKESRIREILNNYSSFVPYPVLLNGERVNTVEALWMKNKKEVSEDEYTEFYRFTAHAMDEPMMRMHFSADAPIMVNALLFVPKENPELFGMGKTEPGVALYSRHVLIDAHQKELLPEWLRFLRGVIDSEDLPLNISRERMQDNALVQKLNRLITKRFLKRLESESRDNPDGYTEFYQAFSRFLKEGVATDFTHREALARLLRFESSMTESGATTGIVEYLDRAKDGQDAIYYQIAANREAIESGPYLEAFKARGLEVLYMFETIDDYVVGSLPEFDGKKLVAVDTADVDLDDLDDPEAEKRESLSGDSSEKLCEWMKSELGDGVSEVRVGKRLVDSPAAALTPAGALSPQMREMMRAMNPDATPEAGRVELEINPRHDVIRGLARLKENNPELAKLVASQVRDNALMAAGLLEEPKDMVGRIYRILGEVARPPDSDSDESED